LALIAPLRILISEDASCLLGLESMENERQNTLLFHLTERNVTKVIREGLGLADTFTADEVQRACGVLDTNAYEVKTSRGTARGLFQSISRINHSCIPNLRHYSSVESGDKKDVGMTIKAARDILPGEQIFVSYTPPFLCTQLRRMILKQTKCFECDCVRCLDPSENGTYLSALQCRSCAEGRLLVKNPTDKNSDYACDSCQNEVPGSTCSMMIDTAMKFLGKGQGKSESDSTPAETIQLAKHLSRFVTPSHQLMVDLKLRLVEQCLSSGYQDSQDEEGQKVRSKLLQYMSETMIQCCQVAPGQSKARAKLSNQYHQLKAKFGFKAEECADLECMALSMSTMDGLNSEILGDEKFM